LCFHFDLLGGVVFMCARTRNILDIIYKDTTPSYICARVKEGRNSDCGQVLHRTSLTGLHNRSDCGLSLRLIVGPVLPVCLTGLTGLCADSAFKC